MSVFRDGFFLDYADDLTFNYYLILGLVRRKARIRFFPISWREEDQVSNVRLVRQTMKMLRILWQYIIDADRFTRSHPDHLGDPRYRSETLLQHPAEAAGRPALSG
jgi:hypothetical protein